MILGQLYLKYQSKQQGRDHICKKKKQPGTRVLNALCIHLSCISVKRVLIPNLGNCMTFLKHTLRWGQGCSDIPSNHSVNAESQYHRFQEHSTGPLTTTNTFLTGFTEAPYLENSPLILKWFTVVNTFNSLYQRITIPHLAVEKSSSLEMNDRKEWNSYTHRQTKK